MSQLNSLFVQNLTAPVANVYTLLTAPTAFISNLSVGTLSGGGQGSINSAQVAAQTASFNMLTANILNTPSAAINNLTVQNASVSVLLSAPVANIASLSVQNANVASLAGGSLIAGSLVANISNLATVNVGNLLNAPVAAINTLGVQTENVANLQAQSGNIVLLQSNTGNIVNFSAQSAAISTLSSQVASIANLTVGTITSAGGGVLAVAQIAAQVASFTSLQANASNLNIVTIGNSLVSPLANISTLGVQTENVANLQAQSGNIVLLQSNTGNIVNFSAQSAAISTLSSQVASIANLTVGTITSAGGGVLAVAQIAAQVATFTALQANVSNLTNVTIGNSLVSPLANISILGVQTENVANLQAQSGNIVLLQSNTGNIVNFSAQSAAISTLSSQVASIANLTVGTITSAGGGVLAVAQIAAQAAAFTTLQANVSNLTNVTIGNSLVSPSGNISNLTSQTITAPQHIGGQFVGNVGNFTQLIAQSANLVTSILGNVQGPLTVSGDIVFTGNLRQTMFANTAAGGLPSYAFANVSTGILVVTNQANIGSLGAGTIFCSNIVGYTAGGSGNTQNISGTSLSYQTAQIGSITSGNVAVANTSSAGIMRLVNTNSYLTGGPGGSAALDYLQVNGGLGLGLVVGYSSLIGVNTLSPQYQLDVNGPVRLANTTVWQQSNVTNLFLGNALSTNQTGFINFNSPGAPGAQGSLGLGIYGYTGGLTIGPTGNVGINQTAPAYPLDVSGPARITGTSQTGAYLRASYAINVSTTVNNATQICHVSDTVGVTSTYQINISLVSAGNYNAITKTYKIPVGYNLQTLVSGNGNWLRCLTESNSGANNGNDFALDIISSGGNPVVTYMRVVRTASGTNPLANLTFNIEVISDAGVPVTLTYDGATQTNVMNGGLYNVNPLCTSMGNVGIMTANPVYPLDVTGAIRLLGNPTVGNAALYLQNASGATGAPLIGFNTFTTPARPTPSAIISGLDNTYSSDLAFSTAPGGTATSFPAAVERMRITIAGNVGIGTPTPGYLLDVNGSARVTSSVGVGATPQSNAGCVSVGGTLWFNNQIQNQMLCLYSSDGVPSSSSTNYYGSGINNQTLRYQVPSGANYHSFMNGTTQLANLTPTGLTVAGTAQANTYRCPNTNSYITSGVGGSSALDYMQLNGGMGTGVTVSYNSQIGINNLSPQYPLDVSGPSRFQLSSFSQIWQNNGSAWTITTGQTNTPTPSTGWGATSFGSGPSPTDINPGSQWNSAGGFTMPVAGIYHLSIDLQASTNYTMSAYWGFQRLGGSSSQTVQEFGGSYTSNGNYVTSNFTTWMAAGDVCYPYVQCTTTIAIAKNFGTMRHVLIQRC